MENQSWLDKELARPVCQLRNTLLAHAASLKEKPKEAAEFLRKAAGEIGGDLPGAVEPAASWLEEKETSTNLMNWMDTPETQAAWGFALLTCPEKERREEITKSQRMETELHTMGALLYSTIKNKSTKIGWGEPGSWFYHDPQSKKINMDPGTALIMGLQNARGIMLHEIGHAAITKNRSEKILELIKKINALTKSPSGNKKEISKEDSALARKLGEELQLRECFWQYTEDVTVNTFAEMEGASFPTDIKLGLLRAYTSTAISRQMEESIKNPLAECLEALQAIGETPEEKEYKEKRNAGMKEIEILLHAASDAYPISRGWINTKEPEQWEKINSRKTQPTETLVEELAGEKGIASLQPALCASRIEALSGLQEEITARCAEERNRICDELFDKFILPELEKLPPPPAAKENITWEQTEKSPEEPKDTKNPENPGESEIPEDWGTLETSLEKLEKIQESEKEKKKQMEEKREESIQKSMGTKSPMETLPSGIGSYEGALEGCREHISHTAKLLMGIKKNQAVAGRKIPNLLPETGVDDFDSDAYDRTQEKIKGGSKTSEEDFHFFKDKKTRDKPAQTRLVLYIDGSGSMTGLPTENTMLTLAIFCEACKKVGDIDVTAIYSGADKTECLCSGYPTEKEKDTISSVLTTGTARGDNEICAAGLTEMEAAIQRTERNKTKRIGATHIVFLTDGGSSYSKENEIIKSIEALLNADPLTTFDCVLIGKWPNTPFEAACKKIHPLRDFQKPALVRIETADSIALEICGTLTKRVRQMKSLAPIAPEEEKRRSQKKTKAIRSIDPTIP